MAMQKEREHHYLKKAQAAYPDLPPGSPMASESPDLLFAYESRVLGIEMTDFVRRIKRDSPLTLRTIESLRGMVASEAKSRFEAKHGIPLWIALHWDDRFIFSKRDVMRIASQLVDVIESDIPHVPLRRHVFQLGFTRGLAHLRGPTSHQRTSAQGPN